MTNITRGKFISSAVSLTFATLFFLLHAYVAFAVSAEITRNLTVGDSGPDVIALKQVLVREKLLDSSLTSNYYGVQTAAAVKKFQEKYAREILTPYGLRVGTGKVGPSTRKKINSIATAGSAASLTPVTNPGLGATTGTQFSSALNPGISHVDVKRLQQFLNGNGYPVAVTGPGSRGNETTYYGPATVQAVALFQKKYHDQLILRGGEVKPSGIFDAPTSRLVNDLLAVQNGTGGSPTGQVSLAPANQGTQGVNRPPTADAGVDRSVTLPSVLHLRAEATDDQKTPEQLSYYWTKVSGAGPINFANDRARETNVNFLDPGLYDIDVAVFDGTYTTHDVVRVTVSAASGGGQSSGSGGGASGTQQVQVTTRHRLTVQGSGVGGGMITGSGITCGNVCTSTYDAGTFVVLTAMPIGNSVFSGWSGDCTGTGTCSLTMNAARTVTASFSTGQVVGIGDTGGNNTLTDPGIDDIPDALVGKNRLIIMPRGKGTVPPAPPPDVPVQNGLTFLATINPAGTRLITLNLTSSLVDPYSEINVPVTLTLSGPVSATNVSITGFQAPFSFTGGSYPGTGGTCGATITATCTIMINYRPGQEIAPEITTSNVVYRSHFKDLTLHYDLGTETGKTDGPVRIVGRTQILSDLSLRVDSGGTGEFGTNFGPIVVGRTGYRRLRIVNSGPSLSGSYTTVARNVSASFSSGPFVTRNNTCGSVLVSGYNNECTVDVLFSPQSEGPFSITATITYDVGTDLHRTKSVVIAGEGFAPDPAQNLLVVYNTLSPESTDLKNYYIANRPGFSTANVLGIAFPGSQCQNAGYKDGVFVFYWVEEGSNPNCETVRKGDFDTYFKTPIVNWITSHPEKDIRHIVMVYTADRIEPASGNGGVAYALNLAMRTTGIRPGGGNTFPTNIIDDGVAGNGYFTHREYPGTMALTTYLWMGSVDATKAYIDKLKSMYDRMPVKNIVISAEGTGQQGTNYYFEDTNNIPEAAMGNARRDAVLVVNPSAPVTVAGDSVPYISSANDVAGYFSWGFNSRYFNGVGHPKTYSVDGSVVFTGKSNWFLMETVESYNGLWDSYQGDFTDWFSANAFGGTNYSHTPAGAVVHVDEPYAGGINSPSYFQCWEKRHLFIDCAWGSLMTAFMAPHGDPWITK
jgi:peptidoglycan hydrolase-like protein with peptidoglycan-binding domain